MKHIGIVVPEQAITSSILDTKRCLTSANEYLRAKGEQPLFKIELVGFKKEMWQEGGTVCFICDKTLEQTDIYDLVIVPGVTGDVMRVTQLNRHYLPWLNSQYKNGAEIASYCVGAFILAATGLLKGRRCATHWMYAGEFREFYPDTILVDDKIIIEQNGIYSSGGGTSYWNLLMYLMEKFTSRQIVMSLVKHFLLDTERTSQAAFMVFTGQKKHGDELVLRVQEYIEQNYREKINIDQLAETFAVVRRTLERKFKKATHNSIAEYAQRIKIEAAKKAIEGGRKTMHEIMYEVGYSDMKAFRDLFHGITGLTPVAYKNKFNKPISLY